LHYFAIKLFIFELKSAKKVLAYVQKSIIVEPDGAKTI